MSKEEVRAFCDEHNIGIPNKRIFVEKVTSVEGDLKKEKKGHDSF